MAVKSKASITLKPVSLVGNHIFSIAIWLSILLHIAVLNLVFKAAVPEKLSDYSPVLEVMLVNAKTTRSPDHPDTFAQANLDRGGNTEQDRKMKSALPSLELQPTALFPKPTARVNADDHAAEKMASGAKPQMRVAELEKTARSLMNQIRSTYQIDSLPEPPISAKKTENDHIDTNTKALNSHNMSATTLEINHLEALISKQQDEYQKRPKRKFVGARTKEYRYALYVDNWRQRVEEIGNLNYPKAARDRQLYGQLEMTVSIRADGSIENIELNRSSGHKILDQAAKHIVELGAPYARFPEEVHKEIDVLSITRTWTFTKEDSLFSE